MLQSREKSSSRQNSRKVAGKRVPRLRSWKGASIKITGTGRVSNGERKQEQGQGLVTGETGTTII